MKVEPSERPRVRSQRMEDLTPPGVWGGLRGPLISVIQSRITKRRG